MDEVVLDGYSAKQITLSATVAKSAALDSGTYDLWADVDVWIKTDADPEINAALTTVNGYKILTGNVVPVKVAGGKKLFAVAGGAGTLNFHRTA